MRLANNRGLGDICGLQRNILSLMTRHEIFRLLDYTTVDLTLGFLAVQQMMPIDLFAPASAAWFPYVCETGELFPLELYVQVVREHGRSSEQVFSVVLSSNYDPFTTVEATELRVYFFERDNHEAGSSSGVHSPSVAGCSVIGIDEVYNGDLDDGE